MGWILIPSGVADMGVTISYRGSLADLDRIEDFEDRVLDLALELGGEAEIWRTANDDDPRRMVRGVMLQLCPGQETTSLLISPEGWLINLCEIEEAEKGQIDGPPWCFVKTQYGPIEGHVALVELLDVLKREFIPSLEVRDEGDYWETRDLPGLTAKFKFLQAAMKALTDGLERHGLSDEAAEDPEILLARIERIAGVVHRTLNRPAEHPPVRWEDEETDFGNRDTDDEAKWDASFKENRRRHEHVQCAIEEHLAQGADFDEAFDAAMLEETAAGLPEEPAEESAEGWRNDLKDIEDEKDEPWKGSLAEETSDKDGDEDGKIGERPRHPLQQRSSDLILRLYKLLDPGRKEKDCSAAETAGSHASVLMHGAGEMMGGLAQSLGSEDFEPPLGLSLVQLKRALRGAAFALGALYPLEANGTIDKAAASELRETIEGLQTDIYAILSRLRQRWQDTDL
jgi:hypothetical protein